ncbi:polysaccharide biosynthesis tyrosine autokinase [Termitidicoccus mucosus]|uniref:Sugar tyrosine-protein kinase n=1 Tax=Termitidicoccus mucosus TaxID=1184151 RepID=A0A178IDB9_9BACT|nr:sugar tyrosine-protein kinase [Opitutaceae bacterium TSB47]
MSKPVQAQTRSTAHRSAARVPDQAQAGGNLAHFSPRNLLNMFLERWWIGLIAGAAIATVFILAQPKLAPVYRSEVKLLFEPQKDQVIGIKEVVDTTTTSNLQLNLHIEQMLSTTFYEYVQSSFSSAEIEQIQAPYRNPDNPSAPPPSLAGIIRPHINIYQQKGTTIVRIVVTNRDPEAAALIANRFSRKYIDFTVDKAMTSTNSAIIFLKNQSEEKRSEVESVERAMQDYRARHNMAALGEATNIVRQKVGLLGNDLAQAQLEQTTLQTLIQLIEDYRKRGQSLYEISAIIGFGNVASLKTQYENILAERTALAERYLEEHPRMRQNALALADTRARLDAAVDLAIAETHARLNLARQHEQRLRSEYAAAEKQAQDLDRITIDYKFLEEDAVSKRQAYNSILSRLNETTIVSQLENVNIKVLDKALVPGAPSNSPSSQILLQAGAFGFILFLGLPIGIGLMDTRVKSSHDVETGLDHPLLGGIKTMKKLTEAERPNVFRLHKDDALAEAYRGIFSEIEIRSPVPFPKRILITSSVPGEGKSLTASNMAAVFAAHGRRTLLVDCDFRRPSLRRYFGTAPGTGLLSWLRAHPDDGADTPLDLATLGIATVENNLHLLPAGHAIKNPTEIIDQIAHSELFNKLSKSYEVIIIDTPPAAVFPDALLLSRFCAELVYVCRFRTVRRKLIKKTLSKFTESGISILGVVLNRMPHASIMNYGYDGYGAYGSDYYKAYQEEEAAAVK